MRAERMREGLRHAAVFVVIVGSAAVAQATDWLPPYVVGGQATVVWQHHPAFRSPYQGPRSLRGDTEDAVSHSYTLYTGVRLLPWLDLYVDPEMIRGEGISGGVGLAGYTNGEVIRNPEAGQSPYVARVSPSHDSPRWRFRGAGARPARGGRADPSTAARPDRRGALRR